MSKASSLMPPSSHGGWTLRRRPVAAMPENCHQCGGVVHHPFLPHLGLYYRDQTRASCTTGSWILLLPSEPHVIRNDFRHGKYVDATLRVTLKQFGGRWSIRGQRSINP